MQKIVQTGLTYFRDKVQAGETPEINKAVVCYVDGLDPDAEIDINATIPANIVDNDVPVTKGKMGDNTVACSVVFDSERGDYVYNWVGLVADTGELITVATFPTQEKYKTNLPKIGNTFANNILLQFANAAEIMDVTITAQSWQFDFSDEIQRIEQKADDVATTVGDTDSGLVKKVNELDVTVGDAASGLVKDVNDLDSTVGDSGSGLVKDVADLDSTVGDTDSGLVKEVNELDTTVGDASAGLVKRVIDLENQLQNVGTGGLQKVEILEAEFNTYVGGNVTIPNGRQWSDFEKIVIYADRNGGLHPAKISSAEISYEIMRERGWWRWELRAEVTGGWVQIKPTSVTAFDIHRSAAPYGIFQMVGYLKP